MAVADERFVPSRHSRFKRRCQRHRLEHGAWRHGSDCVIALIRTVGANMIRVQLRKRHHGENVGICSIQYDYRAFADSVFFHCRFGYALNVQIQRSLNLQWKMRIVVDVQAQA